MGMLPSDTPGGWIEGYPPTRFPRFATYQNCEGPAVKHYASRLVRLLMPGDVVVYDGANYKVLTVMHTRHTTTIHYTSGDVDIYSAHERDTRVKVDEPAVVRRPRAITAQRGSQSYLRVVG